MLDRYLSDSSEDEAADLTGIATAAIDWELPELPRASSSRPGSDIVSVGSSSTSIGSHFSLSGRRKSTLRFQKRNNSTQKQSTGKYQCTFCMATFSIAGNWIRHEEGIHLVLSEWVCSPDGATDAETGLCIFCEPDSCSGSCGSACATKEIGARTFSRKDHLKQHLGRVHHTEWNRLHHGRWKRQLPPPVDSRCGFCGESFNSWAARKTHIAEHFQDGKTMSEW